MSSRLSTASPMTKGGPSTTSTGASLEKGIFWETIFSVLGPFDIFGGSATGKDPLLRSRRELIVQIFRLVDFPENLAVSVAALHVITDICESPAFEPSDAESSPHRVFSILEAAGELENVMSVFVRRLEREETEQASMDPMLSVSSERALLNDEVFISAFGLANLIRLQIVDFLIRNISKRGFNIAHYLLGFSSDILTGQPARLLAPPHADSSKSTDQKDSVCASQFSALHIILELLDYGLGQPSSPIVALDHPSLGEKCYQLICVLLETSATRKATSDYIRSLNQDGFFSKQLQGFSVDVVDPDDESYTLFECRQKKHLFSATSMDLHLSLSDASRRKHQTYVSRLCQILVEGVESQDQQSSTSAKTCIPAAHLLAMEQLAERSVGQPSWHALCENASELVVSILQLCRLLLSCHMPAGILQVKLACQLAPLLSRLMLSQSLGIVAVEAAAAAAMSAITVLSSDYRRNRLSSDADRSAAEHFIAGDEAETMANAAINLILCHSSTQVATRAFAYILLMQSDDHSVLSFSSSSASGGGGGGGSRNLARLAEVVGSDATIPGNSGTKALALSMLARLLCVKDEQSSSSIIDRLARLGLLRGMVADMRSDDFLIARLVSSPTIGSTEFLQHVNERDCSVMMMTDDSDSQMDEGSGNLVYLWNMRCLLFSRICLISGASDRLIDAGLGDVLCTLRSLSSNNFMGDQCKDAQFMMVLTPIFRLVHLLASSPGAHGMLMASTFVASHSALLVSILNASLSSNAAMELSADAAGVLSVVLSVRDDSRSSSNDQQMMALFVRLISQCTSKSATESSTSSVSSVLQAAMQLVSARHLQDPTNVLVSFTTSARSDDLLRRGILPMQVVGRLLEWIAKHESFSPVALIDQTLLLTLQSIERRNAQCASVSLQDRQAFDRELAAYISTSTSTIMSSLASIEAALIRRRSDLGQSLAASDEASMDTATLAVSSALNTLVALRERLTASCSNTSNLAVASAATF